MEEKWGKKGRWEFSPLGMIHMAPSSWLYSCTPPAHSQSLRVISKWDLIVSLLFTLFEDVVVFDVPYKDLHNLAQAYLLHQLETHSLSLPVPWNSPILVSLHFFKVLSSFASGLSSSFPSCTFPSSAFPLPFPWILVSTLVLSSILRGLKSLWPSFPVISFLKRFPLSMELLGLF